MAGDSWVADVRQRETKSPGSASVPSYSTCFLSQNSLQTSTPHRKSSFQHLVSVSGLSLLGLLHPQAARQPSAHLYLVPLLIQFMSKDAEAKLRS